MRLGLASSLNIRNVFPNRVVALQGCIAVVTIFTIRYHLLELAEIEAISHDDSGQGPSLGAHYPVMKTTLLPSPNRLKRRVAITVTSSLSFSVKGFEGILRSY